MSEIDELRKRYGKRRAFEWFMRAEDKRYWKMTQRLVKESEKKMTALVILSAATILAGSMLRYLQSCATACRYSI